MDVTDIVYLAQLENSLDMTGPAIEHMKLLAESKPFFDEYERQLLGLIFKTAIDPIRNTIRTLIDYASDEEDAGHLEQAEMIKNTKDKSYQELREICLDGINFVDSTLLPNCEGPSPNAFYQKLKGDLYRYLLEFANGNELSDAKDKADAAYKLATELAAQQLSPADPMRLGVILNYAVFKYAHADDMEGAKEMLRNAINESNDAINQLSPKTQQETINVINVMNNNLITWAENNGMEEEGEEEDPEVL